MLDLFILVRLVDVTIIVSLSLPYFGGSLEVSGYCAGSL